MTYELTITPQPSYLHVIVRGPNTKDVVTRYAENVFRECAARNYRRVLIEERLEGTRLGTMDVFEIVSRGSDRFRGQMDAIAYVDVNAEGDLMRFAADVAFNRGLSLHVFPTVSDAEKWLLGEEPAGRVKAP